VACRHLIHVFKREQIRKRRELATVLRLISTLTENSAKEVRDSHLHTPRRRRFATPPGPSGHPPATTALADPTNLPVSSRGSVRCGNKRTVCSAVLVRDNDVPSRGALAWQRVGCQNPPYRLAERGSLAPILLYSNTITSKEVNAWDSRRKPRRCRRATT